MSDNKTVDIQIPSLQQIVKVYAKIKPFINETPLLNNHYVNQLIGGQIWFKCQNFQKTGSFKVRGAANKILKLKQQKNCTKVCTHSSGNHAQAVAYISKQLNICATIVMPKDTPKVKLNAVKSYKANILLSGPTVKEQQQMSSKVKIEQNAQFVHPYNDIQIIKGASTIFYQAYLQFMNKKNQSFDYVVFPIGGGGLTSGVLSAIYRFTPNTIPIGVQPYLARDAYLSLQQGKIHPQLPPLSMAEGVRTNLGQLTFSFINNFMQSQTNIIVVSDQQIIEAVQLLAQRMKIVVQISGALVLAAVLKEKNQFKGKKVCCILSGGNIDLSIYFDKIHQDSNKTDLQKNNILLKSKI